MSQNMKTEEDIYPCLALQESKPMRVWCPIPTWFHDSQAYQGGL